MNMMMPAAELSAAGFPFLSFSGARIDRRTESWYDLSTNALIKEL